MVGRAFLATKSSEEFATQWLQLRKLAEARPTTEFFPTFNDALKEAMRQEPLLFFDTLRLDPQNPDSRYNLATLCDKLNSPDEAREHWQAFLKLDPTSEASTYARARLSQL